MATVVAKERTPSPAAQSAHWTRQSRRIAWSLLRYTVMIGFLLLFMLPILWMWLLALRPNADIVANPLALPDHLEWGNLVKAWTTARFSQYMGNSVFYSTIVVAGGCFIACLAGYALARIYMPGRQLMLTIFLIGIIVPFQSIMIPLYYLVRDLHILGTRWALIFPALALNLPFGIFLMRAFFQGLPEELADAARIDGCGEFGVFWRVMLPLAGPGLTTLAVFQFMFIWNAFLLPLILVQREALRPVSLGIMFFYGRYTSDRGMIAAGVLIASLPIVLLYLILQRQFIRGITAGALK